MTARAMAMAMVGFCVPRCVCFDCALPHVSIHIHFLSLFAFHTQNIILISYTSSYLFFFHIFILLRFCHSLWLFLLLFVYHTNHFPTKRIKLWILTSFAKRKLSFVVKLQRFSVFILINFVAISVVVVNSVVYGVSFAQRMREMKIATKNVAEKTEI